MHRPYQITARARILAQNPSWQRTALNYAIKKRTRDSNLLPSQRKPKDRIETMNRRKRRNEIGRDRIRLKKTWLSRHD